MAMMKHNSTEPRVVVDNTTPTYHTALEEAMHKAVGNAFRRVREDVTPRLEGMNLPITVTSASCAVMGPDKSHPMVRATVRFAVTVQTFEEVT